MGTCTFATATRVLWRRNAAMQPLPPQHPASLMHPSVPISGLYSSVCCGCAACSICRHVIRAGASGCELQQRFVPLLARSLQAHAPEPLHQRHQALLARHALVDARTGGGVRPHLRAGGNNSGG